MIEVQDNFLKPDQFDNIKYTMIAHNFPWGISKIVDDNERNYLRNIQLVHLFYDRYAPTGETIQILSPVFNKVQPFSLLRVKANLNICSHDIFEHGMHNDIEDGLELPIKTSILYMNTCDGYTKFEDGTVVESVANRFVTFHNTMKHTGTTTTNAEYRIVINFNYV